MTDKYPYFIILLLHMNFFLPSNGVIQKSMRIIVQNNVHFHCLGLIGERSNHGKFECGFFWMTALHVVFRMLFSNGIELWRTSLFRFALVEVGSESSQKLISDTLASK